MTENASDKPVTQICYEEFGDRYGFETGEYGSILSFQYFNDTDQKAQIEKYAAQNRIWTEYGNGMMANRMGYVNRLRYIVSDRPYKASEVGCIVVDAYIPEAEECNDEYDEAQFASLWADSTLARHTIYMSKRTSLVAYTKIEQTLKRLQAHVSEDIEHIEDLTRTAYLRGLLKEVEDATIALESIK